MPHAFQLEIAHISIFLDSELALLLVHSECEQTNRSLINLLASTWIKLFPILTAPGTAFAVLVRIDGI